MADMTTPSGQAPAVAPPVRTDEEIVPCIRWVQIGKSNCTFDLDKKQSNPIFKMAVDLLMHTNFHRAFTASSTISSIYIQQFWDTIQYDKKARRYRCQLDEQWFVLTKDTLREALQIIPINNNQAFVAPPSAKVLVDFVNQLGYPKLVRNVSNILTNDMFQPWRALTTIINLCLTGKTSGFEIPRALVLQILWGIVTQSNIDYAERIWEEFTQSIHTFMEDRRNLSRHTTGKKRATLILITSIRFTKLIIHHLQMRHKFHPRLDSPLHLSNDEPVLGYLKFSAKGTKREVFEMSILSSLITADIQEASYYQKYQANMAKHRRKPKSTAQKAPPMPSVSTPVASAQPAPTSAPAKLQEKKRKQPTETSDKPPKVKKSKHRRVFKIRSLKSVVASEAEEVPTVEPQVVDADADYQKVLQESMKTAYALPRGPLPPVVIREPISGKYQPLSEVPCKGKAKVTEEQVTHDLLSLQKAKRKIPSDSEEEFEKVLIEATKGGNDEDHAGPDPGAQGEGQKGKDADTLNEGQAGSNPDEMSKGQAGPDPGNAGNEEQSIPSHVVHARSDHKHMDLDAVDVSPQPSMEQLDEGFIATANPKVHQQFKVTTTDTTTTTTTLPPPTAQQQSSTEAMMIKHIGELEHIMADLLKVNQEMEARLDKHGAHLYMLEQLDIPQQVSKALFKALEKSMNRDQSEELVQDLAKARKRKKKNRESSNTPPGSPPYQPPPPLLPAGPSEPSGALGASGSSQSPPPPPPSTSQESLPFISLILADLEMDEDMGPDEQAQLSDDEDIRSTHIPKVNLRQDWWKPLEEELTATPKPTWLISSSDVPVTPNNWASALASNYSPPLEDSLLVQTGDMATFIDWFCKRRECHKLLTDSVDDPILRNNVSKPLPLGGPPGQVTIQSEFFFNKDLKYLRYGSKGNRPALSISKIKAAYYPDAWLEQMVPHQFWIDEECKYDIAAMYGISHWWFQRRRFYIDRHTSQGDRNAVRTHMRILSVVRIEVFSMYGYDYIKKIVLRRADLNEHVIVERDFKYMYPSDFEDLYLLNLQGHLNHLPPKDKKILTTATQLNLTKPQWDATGFEYKHDYTVIDSPRAVIFQDKYRVQMMMHFHEIHKFSDGTLQQIDEALDYRVKEFRINRMNPGLNTRFWTRKGVDRCKAFMFAVQRRLRTRRIFRKLESFFSGRVRKGDYRLLKRTE
uniref:Monodehydroascorbate reductase n=1 Tax=Tanacetum cinerariifolium TaxID=118510 RepID=A0A6L2J8W4_TANCI|nr:monodehydroascorbate reductase [Tanacetum cinerariifolium]